MPCVEPTMRVRAFGWLVAGMLSGGCAGRSEPTQRASGAEVTPLTAPAASRIYTVGEAAFARGQYAAAVELWRHALLQLPETAAADELRHRLILRMAYGSLMAYASSGDRGHLRWAEDVLDRYLVKHEALFGDSERARSERGEVYEILYEVESRLEPESPEPEAAAAAASHASSDMVDNDGSSAKPTPSDVADSEPDRTKQVFGDEGVAGDDDPSGDDGGETRVVHVRRSRLARLEDPAVERRLRSSFSSAEAGLVLTAAGIERVHGPRPLLRAGGLPEPVDEANGAARRLARSLGFAVLRTARARLKDCYADAFARNPEPIAPSTVEITVDEQGSVHKARVVDGGLVDALGDVCMIETLESTRLDPVPDRVAMRIRLPLSFFYEGTVLIDESRGRSFPTRTRDLEDPPQNTSTAPAGLPSIEGFAPH